MMSVSLMLALCQLRMAPAPAAVLVLPGRLTPGADARWSVQIILPSIRPGLSGRDEYPSPYSSAASG